MNQAFSEYVLYEPILRILTARGYTVNCEFPCPGLPKPVGGGDFKKIDFEVNGHGQRFAMEVKWAKRARLDVDRITLSWLPSTMPRLPPDHSYVLLDARAISRTSLS